MPQRLFGHEMFAGLDGRTAHLLVQVMRHGDVHGFDGRIGQQLAVVLRELPDGGEVLAKPIEGRRILVRHGHDFRAGLQCRASGTTARTALANSRPMSPQPMIPKRTLFMARFPGDAAVLRLQDATDQPCRIVVEDRLDIRPSQ